MGLDGQKGNKEFKIEISFSFDIWFTVSATQGNIKFGLVCLRFDKGGVGGDAVDCNMLSFLIFTWSPVHQPPLAQPVWEIICSKSRCVSKNIDGAFSQVQ